MEQEIINHIKEFEDDCVCVSDFGITYCGVLVTHLLLVNGEVQIWAGNPLDEMDTCAGELLPDRANRERIYEEILDNI